MVAIFKVKNTNFINVILFFLFFAVVFLIYLQKSKANQEVIGLVANLEKSSKYRVNYLKINFKNRQTIVVAYPNSFFEVEDFLQIKNGNSVKYKLLNNSVVKITNLKNNNELDELYFSIQEVKGFQILIILLLVIFNIVQMKRLRDIMKMLNGNLEKVSLVQKMNNFTKKHFVITFIFLGLVIFFVYFILKSMRQNQLFFDVYFYKHLILLSGFLIPVPHIIANYKSLKKLDKYAQINYDI